MKQHSLLGNIFIIIKCTRQLLDNTFGNKHIPRETIGARVEELCFLFVRAEML
jgi:hypothetical protein